MADSDAGDAVRDVGGGEDTRTEHDDSDGDSTDSPGTGDSTDSPEIEDSVSRTTRTLHARVQALWMVRAVIPAVFLGGGALVALRLSGRGPRSTVIAIGVAAFVLGVGVVRALALFRSWRYVVREDSLYLHRGVLTIVDTVVPYVRVQHVDTSRGPVERLLGLSSLVVYTAGTRGADVKIPGLTPDRADDLQARLKELAIESEEEDAV